MRIVNSNLALQGSSFTSVASSSYYTRDIITRRVADISGDVSVSSQNLVAMGSQSYLSRSDIRIRSGDGEEPAVAEQMSKDEGMKTAKDLMLAKAASGAAGRRDSLSLDPQAEEMLEEAAMERTPVEVGKATGIGGGYSTLSTRDRIRLLVLEQLLSRLTGSYQRFKCQNMNQTVGYTWSGQAVTGADDLRMVNTVRTTFATETLKESSVSFSATGSVETEDGRSINLELNFNFSQSVYSSTAFVNEIQQKMADPLVINFKGALPEFADNTMSFDLNCDGVLDNVFMPGEGSGLLAFDKNGNGKVDDGSELFGPTLGDGYKELARFDEDGNGWIDENDSVFDKLSVWCKDEQGDPHLVALKDKEVGAIYLGFAKTDMNLYSSSSKAGELKKSGLVLLESGESRVMQEMDLRI